MKRQILRYEVQTKFLFGIFTQENVDDNMLSITTETPDKKEQKKLNEEKNKSIQSHTRLNLKDKFNEM